MSWCISIKSQAVMCQSCCNGCILKSVHPERSSWDPDVSPAASGPAEVLCVGAQLSPSVWLQTLVQLRFLWHQVVHLSLLFNISSGAIWSVRLGRLTCSSALLFFYALSHSTSLMCELFKLLLPAARSPSTSSSSLINHNVRLNYGFSYGQ